MATDSINDTRKEIFGRWLERRIPAANRISLSQKNIFIFPTPTGFVFAFLLLLLILGGINYQNSLVYAVAFLLGSMFLITILYTFRNLSGLTLEMANTGSAFVGEDVEFVVRVSRAKGRGREGLQLGWSSAIKQWAELFDEEANSVRLFVPTAKRGLFNPGRLLVETYFPLGLLRAWTWVDLNVRAVVYPKPIFSETPDNLHGLRDDGELVDYQGSDDFTDLRRYRPGDSLRHVLWGSYAKTGQLTVKEYASYQEPRLWLDLERIPGDLEERLSKLTGHALKAHRSELEFGLRLSGLEITPNVGEAHLNRVLRELALFGLDSNDNQVG